MCGMCLPHCPTYQLYQTETESPRGRIALMQSIEKGRIEASPKALLHIDHCLGCLNCETICPSRVPYGKLIDNFRQLHYELIPKRFSSRQILKQSAKPDGLEKLSSIASSTLVKNLLKATSAITGIPSHLIEKTSVQLKDFYPAKLPASRGRVALFTGCTGKQQDSQTLIDATQLLNHLGFDVSIPGQQACCGAMHQHNGQQNVAQSLLRDNLAFWQQQSLQAVIFFSPACGATLQALKDIPFIDIRAFINQQLNEHPLSFNACPDPVALHESCSQRNMLKLNGINQQLLSHIPGIQFMHSAQPTLCCGAGGLQAIDYPEQGKRLLEQKLGSFDLSQTKLFLSDNSGCSVHIKSAISAYNPDIEILHPVSLLVRQLTNKDM